MAKYVTSSIHYIGVIDESLDKFENQYPLTQGISYNSYFIDDELTAALDTVQADRGLEWLWRLERALHGRKLDYLLVHHLEPDHSDMITMVTRMFPDVTLVMTKRAQGMLAQFADVGAVKVRTVGEGDTLELGKHRLRFVPAPMVHWPEVMVTYDETDQVLFSADAFGTFAAAQPWDDEGRRYYTNIVGKYGAAVQLLLKKLAPYTITTICPLHGPVLQGDLSHYLGLYDTWSAYRPETEGVLVAHASVYGGTAQAARHIAYMLREAGIGEVTLIDLGHTDVSYAVAEAFRLSTMVLACATVDGDMFAPMREFLHHIVDHALRDRRVALVQNGSWSPMAGRLMAAELAKMRNMTVVEPMVTIRTRLTPADDEALQNLVNALIGKK